MSTSRTQPPRHPISWSLKDVNASCADRPGNTLVGIHQAIEAEADVAEIDVRTTKDGVEISGETTIKRLDYGVGQGDWKSTEWVNDEVKLRYRVALARTK